MTREAYVSFRGI